MTDEVLGRVSAWVDEATAWHQKSIRQMFDLQFRRFLPEFKRGQLSDDVGARVGEALNREYQPHGRGSIELSRRAIRGLEADAMWMDEAGDVLNNAVTQQTKGD